MATERDNQLSFKKTGITSPDYKVSAHSITSGQPYDGVQTHAASDGINFDFYAGRKGNSSNANWLKDRARGGNAIATEDFDSWPGELNFATEGTLVFKHNGKEIVVENLLIGQGHTARDRNNWWIASAKGQQVVGSNPIYQALLVPATVNGFPIPTAFVKFEAIVGQVSNFSLEIVGVE